MLFGSHLSNWRQSRFQGSGNMCGETSESSGESHIICDVACNSAAHLSKRLALQVRPT